ncbi:MAG: esterase [Pirellulaceae bacterium]|nr:MAG: esterase [Pirellulaceae bacterium]
MIPERAAKRELLGGLECAVYAAQRETRLIVVLCHGFGAPGTDLVPLSWELTSQRPILAEYVEWVFPAAPIRLEQTGGFDGRAWWPLDVMALMTAVAAGDLDVLRRARPEGLARARTMLEALLDEVGRRSGLGADRMVLGGFSQGAMLATDLALRMEHGPALLAIFSGTLICENEWRQLARHKRSLRVLQSHGRYDTVLPFELAKSLRDLLAEAGITVEFIDFPGDHTIAGQVVDRFGQLLEEFVGDHLDKG